MTDPEPDGGHPGKRVFVHIGAPKTGTTFVQNVLWANREALSRDGVLYPYARRGQHFESMLDLRQMGWGSWPPGRWRGAWDEVAQRSAAWNGHTVILGNEILGGATERQIKRLVASLQPGEVHVIFTARDFARQLVSDWQEHLKHKHTVTLEKFVADLVEFGHDAPAPFGEMFWGLHDADHVLRKWAAVVPAARIHLITVPPPGGPSGTLWHRFCAATGLRADRYDLAVERTNRGLGVAEAELVRRLNRRVRKMGTRDYNELMRVRLANKVLAGRGRRLVLPTDKLPWVEQRSRELVDAVQHSGYDVVGDLGELMPRREDHEGYVPTTAIKPGEMLPSALLGMAALLRIAARQRAQIQQLRERLGDVSPPPPPADPSLWSRGRATGARVRQRLDRARSARRSKPSSTAQRRTRSADRGT